jgi:hypothetical protein
MGLNMFHHLPSNTWHGHLQRTSIVMLLAGTPVVSPAIAQSPADSQIPAAVQFPTATDDVPQAAAQLPWHSLLDGQTQGPTGQTQGRWQLADQEEFAEHGKVFIHEGILTLERGYPATGVRLTGPFPKRNYEIQLDARRTDGGDFFCGLTFPVGAESLTLILGGWGGWAVGLSCIDGEYAIDNETCTVVQFQQDRWYSVRLRVTDTQVKVWIDDRPVITLDTKGKQLLISDRLEPCLPLGLATWHTTGEVRKIRYRVLEEK